MKRPIKPKVTVKELGLNPCITSLKIPVWEMPLKGQYEKQEDDTYLPTFVEVEITSFTKLFISSERRIIISQLSSRAKELLLWIMLDIKAGEDYIWINKQRYMKENNINSVNTYKEAARELVRYTFLSLTVETDYYWINPDFFFNGDRIKKYPTKLVKY